MWDDPDFETFVTLAEESLAYQAGDEEAVKSLREKRAKDKELSWSDIAAGDRPAFEGAMEKHWNEWLDFKSVKVLTPAETKDVRATVSKKRILKSRWALRDKNAGARTPATPLELKPKARLCIGGQNCPDAASGVLKLDAPTVQRTTARAFLQSVVQLGWVRQLANGDIISAFFQGS